MGTHSTLHPHVGRGQDFQAWVGQSPQVCLQVSISAASSTREESSQWETDSISDS